MDIITAHYKGGKTREETLEGFTVRSLDGSDYGQGHLEDIADTVRKQSEAIGRFLTALVEMGTLGLAEIPDIVGSFAEIEPAN